MVCKIRLKVGGKCGVKVGVGVMGVVAGGHVDDARSLRFLVCGGCLITGNWFRLLVDGEGSCVMCTTLFFFLSVSA